MRHDLRLYGDVQRSSGFIRNRSLGRHSNAIAIMTR